MAPDEHVVMEEGVKRFPSLDEMRRVLFLGMSTEEFFQACDALMERYTLRLGSPTLSTSLVTIAVDEGDELFCFLTDGELSHVEYRGDLFLDEPIGRSE